MCPCHQGGIIDVHVVSGMECVLAINVESLMSMLSVAWNVSLPSRWNHWRPCCQWHGMCPCHQCGIIDAHVVSCMECVLAIKVESLTSMLSVAWNVSLPSRWNHWRPCCQWHGMCPCHQGGIIDVRVVSAMECVLDINVESLTSMFSVAWNVPLPSMWNHWRPCC